MVDLGLDGLAREDADRGAKSVAVLGRREGEVQVLNRVGMLHDDISVVQGACSGGLSVTIVSSWIVHCAFRLILNAGLGRVHVHRGL